MESSKLLNWLQFSGMVGILVGLVLVGVQINQTTELTRLQIENEWRINNWERQFVMMGESPAEVVAKAIDQPNSFTTSELLILENYLNHYLEYWATVKQFADDGLVPESRWRDHFDYDVGPTGFSEMTYYFGNPVAQAWWDAVAEAGGWRQDPEFFDAANKAINRVDPYELAKWQDLVRSKLRDRIGD
ncbi:MAG: hypothetical protein O7C67_09510 [Gammaproteobacteria bacterium]|nr:hypothetical protein [Gammaproteobacteria bacterium]